MPVFTGTQQFTAFFLLKLTKISPLWYKYFYICYLIESMKRILSITLLLVYTTLSCGVALQLHYCGGKLASIDFFASDNENVCSCGSKPMKKGCCKDKDIHIQFKAEQKISTVCAFNFENSGKDFILIPFIVQSLFINSFTSMHKGAIAHSPPPLLSESVPTYLLNRVFRI